MNKIEPGETANTLRENLARERKSQGLTYKALSDKVTKTGQRLGALALSKIEDGTRRVSVDDLTNLAEALGVTSALLLGTGMLVKRTIMTVPLTSYQKLAAGSDLTVWSNEKLDTQIGDQVEVRLLGSVGSVRTEVCAITAECRSRATRYSVTLRPPCWVSE